MERSEAFMDYVKENYILDCGFYKKDFEVEDQDEEYDNKHTIMIREKLTPNLPHENLGIGMWLVNSEDSYETAVPREMIEEIIKLANLANKN